MQVEVANQNVIKVLIVMFCDILRDKNWKVVWFFDKFSHRENLTHKNKQAFV